MRLRQDTVHLPRLLNPLTPPPTLASLHGYLHVRGRQVFFLACLSPFNSDPDPPTHLVLLQSCLHVRGRHAPVVQVREVLDARQDVGPAQQRCATACLPQGMCRRGLGGWAAQARAWEGKALGLHPSTLARGRLDPGNLQWTRPGLLELHWLHCMGRPMTWAWEAGL